MPTNKRVCPFSISFREFKQNDHGSEKTESGSPGNYHFVRYVNKSFFLLRDSVAGTATTSELQSIADWWTSEGQNVSGAEAYVSYLAQRESTSGVTIREAAPSQAEDVTVSHIVRNESLAGTTVASFTEHEDHGHSVRDAAGVGGLDTANSFVSDSHGHLDIYSGMEIDITVTLGPPPDPTPAAPSGWLNRVDQFFAGMGSALTFGLTDKIRGSVYGETATRNQTGPLYVAGQVAGTVLSTANQARDAA